MTTFHNFNENPALSHWTSKENEGYVAALGERAKGHKILFMVSTYLIDALEKTAPDLPSPETVKTLIAEIRNPMGAYNALPASEKPEDGGFITDYEGKYGMFGSPFNVNFDTPEAGVIIAMSFAAQSDEFFWDEEAIAQLEEWAAELEAAGVATVEQVKDWLDFVYEAAEDAA